MIRFLNIINLIKLLIRNLKISFNSKKNFYLIMILIFFLSSCDDLFLRFKYETLNCKKNSFNLDKISIKNEKVDSLADVQFGDIYHSIKIAETNDDFTILKNNIMDIANAPGEKIIPGELGKAFKLIKEGKDIDYVGATALELVGSGESAGSFAEILIDNQKTNKVGYR